MMANKTMRAALFSRVRAFLVQPAGVQLARGTLVLASFWCDIRRAPHRQAIRGQN
jgi:hypothetical protein